MKRGDHPLCHLGRTRVWSQFCPHRRTTRSGSYFVGGAGLCPGEEIRRGAAVPHPTPTPSPGPPGAGGRTHLDSADQSFLLTDMLPSPTAAACRAPCSAAHLRPLPAPGRVTWPLISARLGPAPPRSHSPAPGAASEVWASQDKAALISAGAGLPRGRSAGRSHRAAGCTQAGASAGLLDCPGRGRETSCSEPVGPAWRRPPSSLGVAVQSARESGRGAEPRDRGQAQLAAWKST